MNRTNQTNQSDDDPIHEFPEVLQAIEEAPPRGKTPLPESMLFSLERERREALQRRSRAPWRRQALSIGFSLAASVAVLLVGLRFYEPGPRPAEMARVTITSPGDLVTTTRPLIAWTSRDKPSQRYDVWLLPEEGDALTAPAVLVAKKVQSPVSFESLRSGTSDGSTLESGLEAGRAYRVLVCLADAGRMAGTPIPFRVSESATAE